MKNKTTSAGLWKLLSPEDVIIDHYYTFNFNPRYLVGQDSDDYNGLSWVDMKSFHNLTCKVLNELKHCEIEAVPEASSQGKIHYHGKIKIKHILNFYLLDLPHIKHYGSVEIDTIKDMSVWDAYMLKQEKIMKEFCIFHGVPYRLQKEQNKLIEKVKVINIIKDKIKLGNYLCPTSDDL